MAVVVILLTATTAAGQDPLSDATAAYRRGDFKAAVRLFEHAVTSETSPAARANVRVQLAWTHFAMRNRKQAQTVLIDALADAPNLELPKDYYPADFLSLFEAAKESALKVPSQAPARPPEMVRATEGIVNRVQQDLSLAIDTPAVESVLVSARDLEASAAPDTLLDLLALEAEILDRLGRPGDSLEVRGRVAALRAAAEAPEGAPPVPFDALLDARRLIASGQAHDAASLMQGVLAALPSCVSALEVLGEAQLATGKLDEAARTLRTALANSEKPGLLMSLGEVETRRGSLASARDIFRRVTDIDPRNDRAYAALGLLAARTGDLGTAREALDKALAANATLFEARVVRAQLALVDDQPAAAMQHLRRALQVRPGDPWTEAWLTLTQMIVGDTATTEWPADAQATELFRLAHAELDRRTGHPEDALRLATAVGPGHPDADLVRALSLIDLGRIDGATGVLEPLVRRAPEDGRARYLLAYAYYATGRWNEAADALSRASQLSGAPSATRRFLDLARAASAAAALKQTALAVSPHPAP